MTQTTPAADPAPADLTAVSTEQMMFDLLRRANLALRDVHSGEAERLFRAVLAYWPKDGAILQVVAEIALARDRWAEARDVAMESLQSALAPTVFARSCAIFASAAWKMQGAEGVQPLYAQLRPKLIEAMDLFAAKNMIPETNLGITTAMCAGDLDLAHTYFMRRFAGVVPSHLSTAISTAVNMAPWCSDNNVRIEVLDHPKHLSSHGLPPGHGVWDFETKGVTMAVIPGGEMLSGLDFVFTPDGKMLQDSGHIKADTGTAWYPRIHADPTNLVLHIWSQDVIEIDEPALFMSCSQGWHVGHFIVDFLPRLRGLGLRPEMKVALPTETPQKHRDFLRAFGIDDSRIINCDLQRRYRFRELMVVKTGNALAPDPENVCFVTDALRTKPRPAAASRRIFLERDVKSRAVANQAEFQAELDRFNFQTLNLASLSVAEQRAALSSAEVVITTYGSDLLAFYMMNEGAVLLELSWDPIAMDSGIQATCSMVGVDYYVLPCQTAATKAHGYYKKDKDFVVDTAALRATLTAAQIAP